MRIGFLFLAFEACDRNALLLGKKGELDFKFYIEFDMEKTERVPEGKFTFKLRPLFSGLISDICLGFYMKMKQDWVICIERVLCFHG